MSALRLLAHRGVWYLPEERNGIDALRKAFQLEFGLETDLRDAMGEIVVMHDLPISTLLNLADVFAAYCDNNCVTPLALNIKADGLRGLLKPLLKRFGITNYFCFDMSVPETLAYRRDGLRFFTRESEYESVPPLYADAAGVWIDMFHSDWVTAARIREHLNAGKQVAIVSPELHGRPHLDFWKRLQQAGLHLESDFMLCTDFPVAARDFFHA